MSLQVPVPQPANVAVPLLNEEDGVVVSSPPPYAAVHIRVTSSLSSMRMRYYSSPLNAICCHLLLVYVEVFVCLYPGGVLQCPCALQGLASPKVLERHAENCQHTQSNPHCFC